MKFSLEIAIIGVYLIFLLGVGFSFRRFNSDSSDYFRAGAKGTWWLVGSSIFMSGISSYTFVGNGAAIYQSGWSPLVIYVANTLVLFISFLFLAAWFRQMRAVTFGEVVRERFGPRTEQFIASLFVVNSIAWAAVQLYGLSVFASLLADGVSQQVVIVAVGLIVLAYSTVGGNWAVMANDFVQSLIMVPITILVAVLCLNAVGGWSGMQELIAGNAEIARDFRFINDASDFPAAQYGLWWIVAVFVGQMLSQMNMTQGAIRYFSAKDGKEAKKAAMLAGLLMAVGCFIWFIPPMTGRLLFDDLIQATNDDPLRAAEQAYAVTAEQLLPLGFMGVMVVAMFAATISSMDTGINRNAALIVRDIIPAILRVCRLPVIPVTAEVAVSRFVSAGMGFTVIFVAYFYSRLQGTDLFQIALNVVTLIMIPTSVPMLLAFFIKRTAPWAAVVSMFMGFAPSLVNMLVDTGWTYQERTFWVIGAAVFGYLISIPFYRFSAPEYKARVETFFIKMRTPVDFEKEVGSSLDWIQLRMIGRYATVLGVFLSSLILIPNPLWGRLSALFVSGTVLIVGILMVFRARKLEQRERNQSVLGTSEEI
jgi:Na+/proline symporter